MAPLRKNSARSRNATTSSAEIGHDKRIDSDLSTDSNCSERVLVYNIRRNQIFSMPRDELDARTSEFMIAVLYWITLTKDKSAAKSQRR